MRHESTTAVISGSDYSPNQLVHTSYFNDVICTSVVHVSELGRVLTEFDRYLENAIQYKLLIKISAMC